MGLVLEGLRLYAVGALFVVATAASPVFLHVALEPLQTAGVQAFLHLLPSLLVMWVVVDVGPLTPATVHGSAFAAVTYGLQVPLAPTPDIFLSSLPLPFILWFPAPAFPASAFCGLCVPCQCFLRPVRSLPVLLRSLWSLPLFSRLLWSL